MHNLNFVLMKKRKDYYNKKECKATGRRIIRFNIWDKIYLSICVVIILIMLKNI